MGPTAGRVTLLYLGGIGRSGSTLLDILIGQSPGACSTGQLADAARARADRRPCSCGRRADDCPFWGEVLALYDEPGRSRLEAVLARTAGERRILRFLLSPAARREYAAASDELVERIARRAGASLVVDSSKNLTRAAALALTSRLDVRFVHLVRDPRGVVEAMARTDEREGRTPSRLRHFGAWWTKNALASILGRTLYRDRSLLVRFEDLLTRPGETLTRIGEFAGADLSRSATRAETRARLDRPHVLAGNRLRFREDLALDPGKAALDESSGARLGPIRAGLASFWGYRTARR